MFTYAGFEVLGLAASETGNPGVTIPRAIRRTILLLVSLYLAAMTALFLLLPRALVSEQISPFVSALSLYGLGWTGTVMNIVLVSAILSTMLASVFGLGRMLRSLAEEGHTPAWMRDRTDIPYRGILISAVPCWPGWDWVCFCRRESTCFWSAPAASRCCSPTSLSWPATTGCAGATEDPSRASAGYAAFRTAHGLQWVVWSPYSPACR